MRQSILLVSAVFAFVMLAVGCSTAARFKIPAGTTLRVTDRQVTVGEDGKWSTTPFFWSSAGGASYRLYDANGRLLRSGKIKTGFRVASIFWPPAALIYWPMGLKGEYDFTVPADGIAVRDEGPNATLATGTDSAAQSDQAGEVKPAKATKSKKHKKQQAQQEQ